MQGVESPSKEVSMETICCPVGLAHLRAQFPPERLVVSHTPGVAFRHTFFDSAWLGPIQSRWPRASADVVLVDVHERAIGLGMRGNQWPLPHNLWVFGGAMLAGELPREAAARHATRDLNTLVAADELVYIADVSMTWPMNDPEWPSKHDLSRVYALATTIERMASLQLRPGEYADRHREVELIRSKPQLLSHPRNPNPQAQHVLGSLWDMLFA